MLIRPATAALLVTPLLLTLLSLPAWCQSSPQSQPAATSQPATATQPAAKVDRVMLRDVHGLWGGLNIYILADGTCGIQVVGKGRQEKRYLTKLTDAQMAELARLVAEHHFSDILIEKRPGVPDEAQHQITVRMATGKETAKAKWANDKHPDFDALYGWLSGLAKNVKGDPIWTGKYDANWRPEGFDKAPATAPATQRADERAWQKLFADEKWYKDQPGEEEVFSGKLEAVPGADGPSTLMRASYYRLGSRTIYTGGKKVDALDKLVGQEVEIRGKPYDINLEGQSVSEIWPGSVRVKATDTPASAPARDARTSR